VSISTVRPRTSSTAGAVADDAVGTAGRATVVRPRWRARRRRLREADAPVSASRNPSPIVLNASTVRAIASPDGTNAHAFVNSEVSYASRSIDPQLAFGGCTPRPRKLRA